MSESRDEPPPWLDRILIFVSCHNIAAYLVVNERLFSGGQRGEVEMLEKPARENVTKREFAKGRQNELRKHAFDTSHYTIKKSGNKL